MDPDIDAISRYKKLAVWRECGFEIVGQAISVRSAVSYIKSSGTELAVCFEKPPDLDAVKLTEGLSDIEGTSCIVVSPDISPERMRACFLNGAADFIHAPASETTLKECLSRAVTHIKAKGTAAEYRAAAEEYFSELRKTITDETFLDSMETFIADNEKNVASTQSAAEYFGFNKDYFGRLFRKKTGMTFGEFYKRFRMIYAEKLLISGRYKVNEISGMLGFATPDYFTSEFRKYTGRRPLEVKKQK